MDAFGLGVEEEEEESGGWRVRRGAGAEEDEREDGESERETSQRRTVRSNEPEATQCWSRLRVEQSAY